MIPAFFLGISLLVGGVLLLRWFTSADPRLLAKLVRVGGIALALLLLVFLAVTGRLGIVWVALGFLLPLFMRLRGLGRGWRNASGPSPGQQSQVATRFLRMTLDHDTGAMSGTILEGRLRGCSLDELAAAELRDLLRDWRVEDPESASLLEAWLDRADPTWRTEEPSQAAPPPPAAGGAMTREEAYRILGLEPGADAQAVKAAHRALMQKLHPDRGGSDWLAARINEAKDLLLRT